MPLISIVVPTYRRPRYLRLALHSVQQQSFRDFQVIVCDNAAQDETARVVAELDDPRFTYLPREKNLGMVANVYDGFRRTAGELVMKLDDDDEMEPDCLEVLSGPMQKDSEIAVSASDLSFIDGDGRLLEDVYARRVRYTRRDVAPEGYLRPFTTAVARGTFDMVSALIRRRAIDWSEIDVRAGTSYDLHLLLTAAQDAATGYWSRRRLVQYRQHPNSDTVTQIVRQTEGALFARQHALTSGRHTDVEALAASIPESGVFLARALLREGRTAEARAVLRRTGALSTTPGARRLALLSVAPAPLAQRAALYTARASARA